MSSYDNCDWSVMDWAMFVALTKKLHHWKWWWQQKNFYLNLMKSATMYPVKELQLETKWSIWDKRTKSYFYNIFLLIFTIVAFWVALSKIVLGAQKLILWREKSLEQKNINGIEFKEQILNRNCSSEYDELKTFLDGSISISSVHVSHGIRHIILLIES